MSWRDRIWARDRTSRLFHREGNLREIREMIAETMSQGSGFSLLRFSEVMGRRYELKAYPTLKFCRETLLKSGLASFDGQNWNVNDTFSTAG